MAQVKNPLQIVTDGQEAILSPRKKATSKYSDRETYPSELLVMDIKMPPKTGLMKFWNGSSSGNGPSPRPPHSHRHLIVSDNPTDYQS